MNGESQVKESKSKDPYFTRGTRDSELELPINVWPSVRTFTPNPPSLPPPPPPSLLDQFHKPENWAKDLTESLIKRCFLYARLNHISQCKLILCVQRKCVEAHYEESLLRPCK